MTDYSNILPANDREAQKLLSSCGNRHDGKPYDVASLVLDDGVRLSVTTVYGSNDGTPIDEWHQLVRRYDLPSGVDASWLRTELSPGGSLAGYIDRILAGHSTEWNGSNYVGRLTEDGREADEALSYALYSDCPTSDLEVWDAATWLGSATMKLETLAEELRKTTPEEALAEAEYDGKIVIDGGLDAMQRAFEAILNEVETWNNG